MSLPVNPPLWLMAVALVVGRCPVAAAQTISDYSHAQRMALETAMAQTAARSAGLGAPTVGPVASAAAAPVPSTSHRPAEVVGPVVRVSGVFASATQTVVEVAVDGTPYVLAEGQGVPGTAWRVETIAVDRVVLSREPGHANAGVGAPTRTFFALPALR